MADENRFKEQIDWDFFRSIPIADVADAVGIHVDRHGKALCPCHNDHKPSMIVDYKGKNNWHCFSCNEGGSTIDLVLATVCNINPSEARKDKSAHAADIINAVHYLDNIFPGGIMRIDLEANKKNKNEPTPPKIPRSILHRIGLKNNILFEQGSFQLMKRKLLESEIDDLKQTQPNKRYIDERVPIDYLTKTERAEILLDKFMETEQRYWTYANTVLEDFPKLDDKALVTIYKQAQEWIAEIHPYTLAVQEYYFNICDFEFPDTFVEEMDEELESEQDEELLQEYA